MDRTEYRRAVVAHKDRVFTYAAWILGGRDDAADATQDALLRLWQCHDAIHSAAARAWLLTTVHRLCLDRVRQRVRRGEASLEPLAALAELVEAAPSTQVSSSERCSAVGRALAGLSPRERAVIVLREFEGMRYEQIGEVLGRSLSSVKVSLYRARERLRRQLMETVEQ